MFFNLFLFPWIFWLRKLHGIVNVTKSFSCIHKSTNKAHLKDPIYILVVSLFSTILAELLLPEQFSFFHQIFFISYIFLFISFASISISVPTCNRFNLASHALSRWPIIWYIVYIWNFFRRLVRCNYISSIDAQICKLGEFSCDIFWPQTMLRVTKDL